MNTSCAVVMYHYVRDTEKTEYPEIKALSIAEFNEQLDWLQEQFEVVHFDDFMAYQSGERTPKKPTALLTFDDGFIDHYETVFPIFRERNLSGVFFVCDSTLGEQPYLLNVHKTHFLLAKIGAEAFEKEVLEGLQSMEVTMDDKERKGIYRYDDREDLNIKKLLNYELPFAVADSVLETLFQQHIGDPVEFARSLYLSHEQITEMAKGGMTFGPHTDTHRVLSRLSPEEQRTQLSRGAGLMKDLTGQALVPFCYPYGHRHTYDDHTLQILAETGHSAAFTTERRCVAYGEDEPLQLPRFDTKDLPPFTAGVPE